MRTEIHKRLNALEQRAGIGHDSVNVIIRTFVAPSSDGPVKSEARAIISLTDGWRIEREAGESAEEFVNRACRAAPRVPCRITKLREQMGTMA